MWLPENESPSQQRYDSFSDEYHLLIREKT